MSSSLVLSGPGELLPTDVNALGLHLLLDYDLSNPQSVTSTVEALLLDGERVQLNRTGNRTFSLPILVRGEDRDDLTARVDELLDVTREEGATLTWTPDGGLPIVWDCFPAQPTVHWDVRIEDRAFVQQVDLAIPALPFGRSPDAITPTLSLLTSWTLTRLWSVSDLLGSAPAPIAVQLPFTADTDAWLLHRPPRDADQTAPIVTEFSGDTASVSNAQRLNGTYTVVLGVGTYDAPGESRVVTVTVEQDGTSFSQQLAVAYVSSLNLRHLVVGNITLPLIARPPGATSALTITADDSGGSTFHTLMLLDTRGQTVQGFSQADGDTVSCVWIDPPEVGAALGPVWSASTTTKTDAYAVSEARISGGLLELDRHDEDGVLLAYGATSLPTTPVISYHPRWLAERVE